MVRSPASVVLRSPSRFVALVFGAVFLLVAAPCLLRRGALRWALAAPLPPFKDEL